MNQDIALKKDEFKMVLLVCGDPQTGKKTIVNNWIKDKENNIDNKEQSKIKSILRNVLIIFAVCYYCFELNYFFAFHRFSSTPLS